MDPRTIRQLPLLTLQIPFHLAALADANLAQMRNALTAATATADAARRAVADSSDAAVRGYVAFGDHVSARVRTIMDGNLDLASALVRAQTFSDVIDAVTVHAQRQLAPIATRTDEASDLVEDLAGEMQTAATGFRQQAKEAA